MFPLSGQNNQIEVSLKRYFLWFGILILFNIATLVCPFYSF
nr:MAG TPA: hypothetical protein [Caudoviricetes sp.]